MCDIFCLKDPCDEILLRTVCTGLKTFCIQGWFILKTQSQSLCNYSLVGLGFGRNAKSGESRFFPMVSTQTFTKEMSGKNCHQLGFYRTSTV